MGSTAILSAAPHFNTRGIYDASSAARVVSDVVKATFVPLLYTYAAKGPKRRLVNGSEASRIFGTDTFDARKPFATHVTELANIVFGTGSTAMVHRIEPTDIGPRANRTLWLDVLETDIQQYERDVDGSFSLTSAGLKKPIVGVGATIPGFKVKFVLTNEGDLAEENNFGTLTKKAGTQTAGAVQSTMYPIQQWWASSRGEIFNNSGLRTYAPVDNSLVPVDKFAMVATGCYPYRLAIVKRNGANQTARPIETITGDQYVDFTYKPDVINTTTNARFSLSDVYAKHYRHVSNDGQTFVEGEFEKVHAYDHYIEELLTKFYAAEKNQGTLDSDFQSTTFANVNDKKWLFNFIGGQNTNGEAYYTYEIESGRLTDTTNLFAFGGFDGTMWESALPLAPTPLPYEGSFAHLVAQEVAEYANPNSWLMNSAVQKETILIDSGFPLDTKREMAKFIAERKNTFVWLSPYDVNGPALTASTENSRAAALRDFLRLYAESDYFGTQVCRAAIMGRHGDLIGSSYKKQLPLTLEIAAMTGEMMGAADGKWREGKIFDRGANAIIRRFENINVTYTSPSTRQVDWAMGLNWVQSHSEREQFIPGLQTIYEDDSSILNSYFVAMAAVTLQLIGEQVWREFSGSVRLTDDQLIEAVNAAVNREVQDRGRFCDMFKIVPKAQITPADKQRGYSWTLVTELYAGVMKTVMTFDVNARRMSDLAS